MDGLHTNMFLQSIARLSKKALDEFNVPLFYIFVILSPKFRTITQQESLQACQATGERYHSPHYNRQVSNQKEKEGFFFFLNFKNINASAMITWTHCMIYPYLLVHVFIMFIHIHNFHEVKSAIGKKCFHNTFIAYKSIFSSETETDIFKDLKSNDVVF